MSRLLGSCRGLIYGFLAVIAFFAPLYVKDPYNLHILISIGINVILASSLRLILTSCLLYTSDAADE